MAPAVCTGGICPSGTCMGGICPILNNVSSANETHFNLTQITVKQKIQSEYTVPYDKDVILEKKNAVSLYLRYGVFFRT